MVVPHNGYQSPSKICQKDCQMSEPSFSCGLPTFQMLLLPPKKLATS